MEAADPHALRATFDDSPELYDSARAVAPPELFDELVALARLEPGAQLLEVGCGTGQATLPLARRGFEIVAVELGESLAAVARRKLVEFPHVKVVTSSFEDWDPAGARFDGVVSFNAFHWIDPEVRFAKSAEVLRPGGALAVVGMRLVEHDAADPVWLSLKEYEDGAVGEGNSHSRMESVRDRSREFLEDGHFREVTLRRHQWDITFDAGGYVDLLRTQSVYRALDETSREELFEKIHRRIEDGGGTISPTMMAVLYVAKRA